MQYCVEWFVDQKVKARNKFICDNYPTVSPEILSQKYHVSYLYILFILKKFNVTLLSEDEELIKKYITDDFPLPKEGYGFIYKIYNNLDDMIYVGQTENSLIMRWNQHKKDYFNNTFCGRKLHQHFSLLGIENFHIILLEEVPIKFLNEKEQEWITKLNSFHYGLNMTIGGEYFKRQEFF